jgi:hypothetical protein
MKKLRSDSKWHQLPQARREEVLNWLFDEGLSYVQTLKRARKKFGVKASISSIKRFYYHVCEERRAGELALAVATPDEFKKAASKILGMAAFNVGMDCRDNDGFKKLVPLVKLMQKERRQELDAQRLALELARLTAGMKKEK